MLKRGLPDEGISHVVESAGLAAEAASKAAAELQAAQQKEQAAGAQRQKLEMVALQAVEQARKAADTAERHITRSCSRMKSMRLDDTYADDLPEGGSETPELNEKIFLK
mgnify:CR=1 FL=1